MFDFYPLFIHLSKDIDLIPLSDDTVTRRINDMAKNIESEIISRLKQSSFYSLQIDDTTDVSNDGQLMCYVRYEFNNDFMKICYFQRLCQLGQLENKFLKPSMSTCKSMKLIGKNV